ncbi:hypothetical protein CDD83_4116 [Cordyceps sp. RAO-2017]|nr:hypothetical protein CDD83_4116 [Cordyceps sp. RAO-2017]
MHSWVNLVVRLICLMWTLIITALIGNVVDQNINGASSAMAALDWVLFVCAWSWLACFYSIAATYVDALANPFITIPIDFFAWLFTIIAGVVLAAKLTGVNCGNWEHRNFGRGWIAFGSHNTEKRCREIQASTVMMWFLWVCFCVGFFLTCLQAKGAIGGFGRSSRRSRPNMSQVA